MEVFVEAGQSRVAYDTATPKYTEVQKSQIPNDYYIKTITPTVASEDIYEIQYYEDEELQHYGQYVGLSACEADMLDGDTCVKIYSAGETYYDPNNATHEVCATFNSEVCLQANNWTNASEMMASMKAAGAIYCNESAYANNGYLVCSNEPLLSNGTAASESLRCSALDDGTVNCVNCSVEPSGSSGCGEMD